MEKIIFDTETTGLLAPRAAPLSRQPYITEIYAVKIDENFNIISELESFIKIPIHVPDFITKITRIDDKMLENAPTFEEISDEIFNFFSTADEMIAHNLPFDKSMIKYQFKRANLPIVFPLKQTCTIQHSMSLEGRRLNLSALHEKLLGKPLVSAHRAKNDVFGLVRVYHKMLEMGLCE